MDLALTGRTGLVTDEGFPVTLTGTPAFSHSFAFAANGGVKGPPQAGGLPHRASENLMGVILSSI